MMDRSAIAGLIPHAGTMCLLDRVVHWDARSICCQTARHRRADNPLRRPDGRLGAAAGVELAAQAMALHGRLTGGANSSPDAAPKPGYLASLRDLRLRIASLEHIAEDLLIDAVLLMGDAQSATYAFALTARGRDLIRGRATVLFDIEAR